MTDTAVPPLQQLQQHKPLATESRTITDTLVGEHSHHIVGYSLIKGIGDGEPIASERFMVGGHDWVSGWVGGVVVHQRARERGVPRHPYAVGVVCPSRLLLLPAPCLRGALRTTHSHAQCGAWEVGGLPLRVRLGAGTHPGT